MNVSFEYGKQHRRAKITTTIKDFGRHSDRFGDIGHYYAFPIRFWFGNSQLAPEDVLTWLRENATGYYKVISYTHKDSKRFPRSKEFETKVIYVDKVYLANETDAAKIKMSFDVRDVQVKRPRMAAKRKKKKTYPAAK